jgi:D-sedoheptulose 7-phosphate isomerase
MKEMIIAEINEHIELKKKVLSESIPSIEKVAELFIETLANKKKILICGNGGSAADAQHMAGELIGRFKKERAALPAIALSTDTSILTCIGNDYSFDDVFKRQVEGLAKEGDLVVGLSTSGNSKNVIKALEAGKKAGARTAVLTGGAGGKLKDLADVAFVVPSANTPRVQEVHITVIHIICRLIEERLF